MSLHFILFYFYFFFILCFNCRFSFYNNVFPL